MTPRLCWIIYQQKTSGRKFRVQLYPIEISILSNALHSRERERELDERLAQCSNPPTHGEVPSCVLVSWWSLLIAVLDYLLRSVLF